MKTKVKKSSKGITLIALVITIIVLLILAGVSISMLTGDNGIITQAKKAKEKTEEAKIKEEQELENLLNRITSEVPSEEGYNESKSVNSPRTTTGMIPIKYNGTDWVVCSKEDPEWYSYDDTKKWANIMLSDGTYKEGKVQEGQVVKENELGSMYVWIPRYAYRIAGEKNIEVNFLKGNTNQDKDGKEYTEDENVDVCGSMYCMKNVPGALAGEYRSISNPEENIGKYLESDFHSMIFRTEYLKKREMLFHESTILTGFEFLAAACLHTNNRSWYQGVTYTHRNIHRPDWISTEKCKTERPQPVEIAPGHVVKCHYPDLKKETE